MYSSDPVNDVLTLTATATGYSGNVLGAQVTDTAGTATSRVFRAQGGTTPVVDVSRSLPCIVGTWLAHMVPAWSPFPFPPPQVASNGLLTMYQGGFYIAAGGLHVATDGLTANSGMTITSGGAQIDGTSYVRIRVCRTPPSPSFTLGRFPFPTDRPRAQFRSCLPAPHCALWMFTTTPPWVARHAKPSRGAWPRASPQQLPSFSGMQAPRFFRCPFTQS